MSVQQEELNSERRLPSQQTRLFFSCTSGAASETKTQLIVIGLSFVVVVAAHY